MCFLGHVYYFRLLIPMAGVGRERTDENEHLFVHSVMPGRGC